MRYAELLAPRSFYVHASPDSVFSFPNAWCKSRRRVHRNPIRDMVSYVGSRRPANWITESPELCPFRFGSAKCISAVEWIRLLSKYLMKHSQTSVVRVGRYKYHAFLSLMPQLSKRLAFQRAS